VDKSPGHQTGKQLAATGSSRHDPELARPTPAATRAPGESPTAVRRLELRDERGRVVALRVGAAPLTHLAP
jgi:hypothetical protein